MAQHALTGYSRELALVFRYVQELMQLRLCRNAAMVKTCDRIQQRTYHEPDSYFSHSYFSQENGEITVSAPLKSLCGSKLGAAVVAIPHHFLSVSFRIASITLSMHLATGPSGCNCDSGIP